MKTNRAKAKKAVTKSKPSPMVKEKESIPVLSAEDQALFARIRQERIDQRVDK